MQTRTKCSLGMKNRAKSLIFQSCNYNVREKKHSFLLHLTFYLNIKLESSHAEQLHVKQKAETERSLSNCLWLFDGNSSTRHLGSEILT